MKLSFHNDNKETWQSVECHLDCEKEEYDETISSLESITGYGANEYAAKLDWWNKFHDIADKLTILFTNVRYNYLSNNPAFRGENE